MKLSEITLKAYQICIKEGETQKQFEGILIQKCIHKFLDQA